MLDHALLYPDDNADFHPIGVVINGRTYGLDRKIESHPKFAALPRLRDAYEIDESQWEENDQFAVFNPRILNQIQNGCVGHGGDTMFELGWMQSGQDLPTDGFSPTFLYAQLNGGVDQGAMIGDLIGALTGVGQVTADDFPESKYLFRDGIPPALKAEAAKYQADEMYAFSTWAELGTALSRGFGVADSVMVGRTFMNIDANGVVGVDRGPGNHCVCAGGLRKLSGGWQAHHQNSWGATFGQSGRFYTTQDHVNCQTYMGQACYSGVAIKSVKRAG